MKIRCLRRASRSRGRIAGRRRTHREEEAACCRASCLPACVHVCLPAWLHVCRATPLRTNPACNLMLADGPQRRHMSRRQFLDRGAAAANSAGRNKCKVAPSRGAAAARTSPAEGRPRPTAPHAPLHRRSGWRARAAARVAAVAAILQASRRAAARRHRRGAARSWCAKSASLQRARADAQASTRSPGMKLFLPRVRIQQNRPGERGRRTEAACPPPLPGGSSPCACRPRPSRVAVTGCRGS